MRLIDADELKRSYCDMCVMKDECENNRAGKCQMINHIDRQKTITEGTEMTDKYADPKYKEILWLDKLLDEEKIEHHLERLMDGWIIMFLDDEQEVVGDFAQHHGTYHCRSHVEGYGFLMDDCWITTAEGALQTVKEFYNK